MLFWLQFNQQNFNSSSNFQHSNSCLSLVPFATSDTINQKKERNLFRTLWLRKNDRRVWIIFHFRHFFLLVTRKLLVVIFSNAFLPATRTKLAKIITPMHDWDGLIYGEIAIAYKSHSDVQKVCFMPLIYG